MSQYLFMTLDAPQPAPIDAPPSPLASSSGLPLPSEGEADTVNSDNASYGSNEDPLPHLDVLGDAQSADISNYVDPAHAPAPPILIAPNFTPPPHTHPLVLRFIHLVRLANGKMGMTEVDINKILQLLMHPELAQAILSEFTNCKELERFELEQLSGLGRGWSVATFNVDGFKPQILFFRDPAQAHVGDGAVVAAIILYSDVTHLSENGRKKAWPVMMTIANIRQGGRWATSGHCLLGNLPIPPKGMPSAQKTQLFQQGALTMLHTILEGRECGFLLKDPNGVEHLVKPMLYAWVCDYPESGKVTCTLSGGTSRPCSICYAEKEHLDCVTAENTPRTPARQQWIVDNWANKLGTKKAAGVQFSTFGMECALWLWDVPGAPWANPYLAIMPDIMHQADLGILHHMISAIRSSHKGSLATFDERLTQIREETRMTNLRFPETAYFESGACVAAHEHRAVLMTRWRRSG
ncbi:hypothetical protein CLOP_g12258 [Closterium sp. NIES-67]|nr:hypothetical protein CLOP_g12258 [Closterium sp. NIES-67]